MLLKEGVKIKGIKPETVIGIMIAESVWKISLGTNNPMIITSVIDGKHMSNSLHYKGYGFDIRTNFLSQADKLVFFEALLNYMNFEFDIVFEKTHIHVEYDPK